MFELTRSLAGTVRLEATYRALAQGMLAAFDAQIGVIVVPEARRNRVTVAAGAATRPELHELLDDVRAGDPPPYVGTLFERTAQEGGTLRLTRTGSDWTGAPPTDGVVRRLVEAARRRFGDEAADWSLVAVPLAGEGHPVAGMIAVRTSGHPFQEADELVARSLARHAALAVRNARSYEQQLQVATTLQHSLLPPPGVTRCGGLELGSAYRSSAVDAALVGGDFLDVIELPDGRGACLIGDICGKGVRAAVDAATVRYSWRALAGEHPEPPDLLAALNAAALRELPVGTFATVLYLVVERGGGRVTVGNAGNLPPIVLRTDGSVAPIVGSGPALGIVPDAVYPSAGADLAPGDGVLAYTDGLEDARSRDGGPFGVDRVRAAAVAGLGGGASVMADQLLRAVRDFTGDTFTDDVALLALRRPPAPPAS
jgi:serine phosphatase RsbU (regulator of sigma subunit)